MQEILQNKFIFNDLNFIFVSLGIFVTFINSIIARKNVHKKKFIYYLVILLFIMSFIIVVTTKSWFFLMVGWELVTISTTLLLFWDESETAKKYFIIQFIGGSFLLLVVIAAYANGYSEITFIKEKWLQNIFILAVGIKSAIFGFHFWIPIIYQKASFTFAAISSGLVVNLGYILLLKIISEKNELLFFLGIISVFYGAFKASREDDYKLILAFSTISQMGFVALGISSGNIYGFYGAVFYIISHSLAKTVLFNNAIFMFEEKNTINITEYNKKIDFYYILILIIASLSLVGFPLFLGYNSKYLIKYAVTNNPIMIILVHLASTMTAFYLFRILFSLTFNNKNFHFKKISSLFEIKNKAFFEKLFLIFPLVILIILAFLVNEILDTEFEFSYIYGFVYAFIYILIVLRLYLIKIIKFYDK